MAKGRFCALAQVTKTHIQHFTGVRSTQLNLFWTDDKCVQNESCAQIHSRFYIFIKQNLHHADRLQDDAHTELYCLELQVCSDEVFSMLKVCNFELKSVTRDGWADMNMFFCLYGGLWCVKTCDMRTAVPNTCRDPRLHT